MKTFEPLYEKLNQVWYDLDQLKKISWQREIEGKSLSACERKELVLSKRETRIILKMHDLPKDEFLKACRMGCLDGITKEELKEWLEHQ